MLIFSQEASQAMLSSYQRSDKAQPEETINDAIDELKSDVNLLKRLLLNERQRKALDKAQLHSPRHEIESKNLETIESSTGTSSDFNSSEFVEYIERSRETNLTLSAETTAVSEKEKDPLVFDLDNNGFNLQKGSINFDLDADGQTESIPLLAGNDRYLALDRNNNGRIDSGSELFGDQHGAANGFLELAKFDNNQDGLIDQRDPIYHRLLLTNLKASDETILLSTKVDSINLDFHNVDINLDSRATIRQAGEAHGNSKVNIANLWFYTHN